MSLSDIDYLLSSNPVWTRYLIDKGRPYFGEIEAKSCPYERAAARFLVVLSSRKLAR